MARNTFVEGIALLSILQGIAPPAQVRQSVSAGLMVATMTSTDNTGLLQGFFDPMELNQNEDGGGTVSAA